MQVYYFTNASMSIDPNSVISRTLAPPGAGLPRLELFFARLLTGWEARRTTRQQSVALFREEKSRILELTEGLPSNRAGQPVLIRRLRGMEDSSRCWSAWMTLDHLRIVNSGTARLIELLVQGKTPDRVTGPADVKPSPAVDEAVIEAFRQSCSLYEETVAHVDDLDDSVSWPHPWFGPMNAARWHFFTAFHMRLHRHQIESIRRELRIAVTYHKS
jgi:hypothetical protein